METLRETLTNAKGDGQGTRYEDGLNMARKAKGDVRETPRETLKGDANGDAKGDVRGARLEIKIINWVNLKG